ncbi:hypothetical protein CU098_010244 [Rhizopus stolonifer]|uniref:Coth-domain-containing protein n=1 Tax=Rhizopus stolonifer TaxID=4846 RepID=A0A367K6U4_RHIST|nr:hypothetical protein CU098_010244 [Rhizopus stolonifer]
MLITKAITTLSSLSAVAFISIDTSPASSSNINYNVINVSNNTYAMGVVVDNVTYPLTLSEDADILYTGSAPVAYSGYSYVQINKVTNATEMEPFLRKPIETNTFNEFFNRTWNQYQVATLPNIYEPVKEINRIKTNLHREGEIATIHITANQTEFDRLVNSNITDDYELKTTKLSYVNLNETFSFKHVKLSLSGHSSRLMPKVSFNLKLKKKDRLYQFRHIKLRAMITDPSYLREKLSYDVIKSVGLLSSEYSYCRLFVNGRPLGLFGIMEPFQDPWLANSFADGNEDYENGYLYQGLIAYNIPDLTYHENKTMYTLGEYKVKVPAPGGTKEDFQPLIDFTKAISKAPTNGSNAVESWNKIMNMDVFLRNMAVEILLGLSDGFIAGHNNFYLYKNPSTDRMFYIPADFDLNMGNSINGISGMLTGNYSTFPQMNSTYLMDKLLQVPEFKQTFESYLFNITQNLVNPTVMNNRINDLSNMLKEDVAWDQDLVYAGFNFSSMFGDFKGINMSGSDMHLPLNNKPDNTSAFESALLKVFKDPYIVDFGLRILFRVPFETAVNGPTGYISLVGIKEWVQKINENVLNYFNHK